MRRWLGVLCAVCAFGRVDGQVTPVGVITGRILDAASHSPIRGAIVLVTGTRLGSQADSLGRFRIDGVTVGRSEIRTRLIGYADRSDSVDVRAGETTDIVVQLTASVVALGAVRSEGKAVERELFEETPIPGVITISGKTIAGIPRLGETDVLRAAQLLPGVQARNDYSAGLNVRGGEADQNLILMDGFPIFNPFHFGGLFGTFIDATVGDVQLLTGGFPAEYGGRLSSVFDVHSTEEIRPGLHGSSTVSLLASNLTLESAFPGGRGSWYVAARRTYADEILKLVGKSTIPYHFSDLQAHATYRLGSATTITATVYSGRDAISVAESADENPFQFWWGNTVAGVKATSLLGHGLELDQRVSWSKFGTGLDFGAGALQLDNQIGELGVSGDLHWSSGTHDRAVGYEVTHDNILYNAVSTESDAAFFRRQQSPTALAAYYDDVWHPTSKLLLDLGARAEQLNGSGWRGLSPRASVKYFVTHDIAITGAVGRYSQWLHSLAREDIPIRLFDFWEASDRTTPVSRATHYILGTEAWFGKDRLVRVEGYVKHYDSLLEPNTSADPSIPGDEFNVLTGKSYGVDVLLQQLERGKWGGWLAYGYGYNRRSNDTTSFYPAQDRRHNVNVVLTYRPSKRYLLSGRFGYATGTPYTDIIGEFGSHTYNIRTNDWSGSDSSHLEPLGGVRNAARYPSTQRLDLSITRDFGGRTTITPFFSLINAYDAHNVFTYVFDYTSQPATRKALSQIPLLPTLGVSVTF